MKLKLVLAICAFAAMPAFAQALQGETPPTAPKPTLAQVQKVIQIIRVFPQAMLLVQKAEYEWPNPLGVGRFKPEHPVTKLEGDKDVFGDGSVTIISTPGHTPGHQSLLVKLPKTGALLLSGDAVHFKSNWDNRGVPAGNTGQEQTKASMNHMAEIMAKEKAALWINHDKAQRDSLKMSPEFYE